MAASAANREVERIRARLDHPVIDADGHLIEYLPVVYDLLDEVAGAAAVDGFRVVTGASALTRPLSAEERRQAGAIRTPWWGLPAANTLDRATALLPALLSEHPKLRLELTGSNANLSLTRREADLALRLGRPSDGSDRLRKVGVLDYGVYAARSLGEAARSLPWLSYDEELSYVPEAVWLRKQLAAGEAPLVCVNQADALRYLASNGLGRAVLPRLLAEGQESLRCLSGPEPVVSRDIWLVVHPELRKTARVSAVVDWILDTCMERLRAV